MTLDMVCYIILRLSDIFKYGLWPLYVVKSPHKSHSFSVFSVISLTLSILPFFRRFYVLWADEAWRSLTPHW